MFRLSFVTTILLLLLSPSTFSQCKIAEIVKNSKTKIESPYIFDGFTTNNLNFTSQKKVVRSEFLAFKGQKYRLHFGASGFEETVQITISVKNKKDELETVTTTSIGGSVNTFTFDIIKAGTYIIEYSVPPTSLEIEHKECIIMLNSYSTK